MRQILAFGVKRRAKGFTAMEIRPCKTVILFNQMVCDAEEPKFADVKKWMSAANGLACLKHCPLERDAQGRGRKG
jgi:hypothetical protein